MKTAVIFENEDVIFPKNVSKDDGLLSFAEMFKRVNEKKTGDPEKARQQREEFAQKDLIQQLELTREQLEAATNRYKTFEKLLEEANEKIEYLQKGMIEALKETSYWITQEYYKEKITELEETIRSLRKKSQIKTKKGIKVRNETKEYQVFRYLVNNKGKIINYRTASQELGISLSTLHGIVKRLNEEVKTCNVCGNLIVHVKLWETIFTKYGAPIRVQNGYFLCVHCATAQSKPEDIVYHTKERQINIKDFLGDKYTFKIQAKEIPWIPFKYKFK